MFLKIEACLCEVMSPRPTTLEDLLTNGQVPELPKKNTRKKKAPDVSACLGPYEATCSFFLKKKVISNIW